MFQYSLAALRAVDAAWPPEEPVVVYADGVDADDVIGLPRRFLLRSPGPPPRPSLVRSAGKAILGRERSARLRKHLFRLPAGRVAVRPDLREWYRVDGVDLALLCQPDPRGFEGGLRYLMAVHDLQHRLQPEFPEVSANGELAWREYVFGNGIGRAQRVLVDSDVGKEDLLEHYGDAGIDADRIDVIPFVPPPYLGPRPNTQSVASTVRRLRLPAQFAFYPAQWWPHKNHRRLIEALALLRSERGVQIPVVMTGSDDDPLRRAVRTDVMRRARELGITDLVHTVGYVDDSTMASLYAGARLLVFPTFFGPTNIPVIEAWAMSCPVVTSDIRGIREQCGAAAVLADPRSVEDMAEAVHEAWTDEALRSRLVAAGQARLATYGQTDFGALLSRSLDRARDRG